MSYHVGRHCSMFLTLLMIGTCCHGLRAVEPGKISRHYLNNFKTEQREPGVVLAQTTVVPPTLAPGTDPAPAGMMIAELLALAEMNNPTLKLLKQRITAAKGQWIQAGVKANPVLAYEAEEIGDGGKAGKHGFVVEQEITTNGKRKWDRSIAAWEHDETRRRWELQCYSIRNDVRSRAYEVLAAQKTVEIRSRLAEIGTKSVQAAVELGKAGEVSKIDLLQIRAKANESQAALKAAKSAEQIVWKKLVCMVGMPELSPTTIADSLEAVDVTLDREAAWAMLVECGPQFRIAEAKVRQAQAELARQQAETVPDISVSGGVYYDYGERQTLASFGVGVPLRVFDKNRGNIMKARADLIAAHRELDRLKLALYEEFSEIYATLESSREQAEIYRNQILPDVQESLELSLNGYRQGEYNYMDVLSAQQLYLETQTQYIEVLKNRAVMGVFLEGYLAKGGLETDLE